MCVICVICVIERMWTAANSTMISRLTRSPAAPSSGGPVSDTAPHNGGTGLVLFIYIYIYNIYEGSPTLTRGSDAKALL